MKASQGNTQRKKLADISNIAQAGIENAKPQQKISIVSKEHVEMLQKENVTLMKLLSDRNKFIEITGAEMQKMRINLHKMQQENQQLAKSNQQLAKSNSQMLVELNSGKDRLKVLEHELGCKNALLKAKKLEAEIAKEEMRQQLNDEVTTINCEEAGDSSLRNEDNEKPANTKRRHQSKNLGSSKQVQPQDEAENKRPCTRRQSARFKPEAVKLNEDCLEAKSTKCEETENSSLVNEDKDKPANIKTRHQSKSLGSSKQVNRQDNAESKRPCVRRQSARFAHEDSFKEEDKCPPLANLVQKNGSTSFCTSPNELNGNPALRFDSNEFGRRSSLSRPSRQAAKKVQSYKEIPVNIKMRRPA